MSLVAWFDIPLALLAALCFVLAWQDARRSKRAHERWMNRRVAQAQRAEEDLGYLLKEPYDEAEGAYKAAVSELTEAETATGVEIKGGGVIAKRAEIAPRELFSVVTTAQVERTYKVQAKDEEQARARLRTHLSDPDMLRDGVVVEQREKQADATPQRIKAAVKATVKP
jgi:hypothetical protein